MPKFEVFNETSWHTFGIFDADNEAGAIAAMMADSWSSDVASDELQARPVSGTVTISRGNMGELETEADYQAWVRFVQQAVTAFGDIEVRAAYPGHGNEDVVHAPTSAQKQFLLRAVTGLWDAFCRTPTAWPPTDR